MMRSQEPGLWSQLPHLMASPRVARLLSRSPWGPMEGDVGGGASYPVQEEVRVERAVFWNRGREGGAEGLGSRIRKEGTGAHAHVRSGFIPGVFHKDEVLRDSEWHMLWSRRGKARTEQG